ncbi:uncharacterized protein PADG_08015 [Paracoccidioides brasiliensis Pb18]|uniref:Adenylyltransferase and sulfurtransferase uba4 n=1 Tax=Paracoccidioides brasiliensis (strain Pb18) TaxID=502780 RepID=C1GL08_PARBD|nr:uncharacterized protein PADG_08015 [Paracoccidioides brasiliensis Pb18]EEH43195.1 hypothetical protein PADG_08015 [Paracoccidioides brasiliensis Pb18]
MSFSKSREAVTERDQLNMKNLFQSRKFLQQQIATTEVQLSQLKAELERTERQIATEIAETASHQENGKESQREELPQGRIRRYPLQQDEYRRYGRQMIVEQIRLDGQLKLRGSSVLIVGAGGLGCPAALYLAGAGVGVLGIVDGDTVEASNLHRQVLHRTKYVGKLKVDSAIEYLKELNPRPKYIPYPTHLTPQNAPEIFTPYSIILDCTDNPATRYLISDTAVLLRKPLISASALRTDGQLMILNYPPANPSSGTSTSTSTSTSAVSGPCYRCIFPKPPPAASVISCADGGILGPVVGVMGVLQALETIRVLTQPTGTDNPNHSASPSAGRHHQPIVPTLHLFSAFSNPPFRSVRLRPRRVDCAACSATGTITLESLRGGSMDYVQFCGGVAGSLALLGDEERLSATEYWRRYAQAAAGLEEGDEAADGDGDVESPILIDVREAVQYGIGAIAGSINIPMSQIMSAPSATSDVDPPRETACNGLDIDGKPTLPSWLPPQLLDTSSKKPIHVVCRLGNDSQVVVRKLKELGVDRGGERWVGDIRGGLRAWREEVEADFPDY